MNKNKIKKILTYTIIFEPAEEGGYVVYVPALPGCVTQGDDFEEAVEMVKDAISGYLAVLRQGKEEIPEESGQSVISKVDVPVPS